MSDGYDFGVPLASASHNSVRDPDSMSGVIRGMPKGASKFFPGAKMNNVTSSVWLLRNRGHIDFKVACRTVTENGVKGVRCWRLDAE